MKAENESFHDDDLARMADEKKKMERVKLVKICKWVAVGIVVAVAVIGILTLTGIL